MKFLIFFLCLIVSHQALAQKRKPLPNREEIYKKIDKEIDKQTKLAPDKKEALKRDVRKSEVRVLKRSKEVEKDIRERTADNKLVNDFFEEKDKHTKKITIDGEEYEVLKDAEVLRNELEAKRKKLVSAYKKDTKHAKVEVAEDLPLEKEIIYPIKSETKYTIAGNTPSPVLAKTLPETTRKRPWGIIIGIFIALISVLVIIFTWVKKR